MKWGHMPNTLFQAMSGVFLVWSWKAMLQPRKHSWNLLTFDRTNCPRLQPQNDKIKHVLVCHVCANVYMHECLCMCTYVQNLGLCVWKALPYLTPQCLCGFIDRGLM